MTRINQTRARAVALAARAPHALLAAAIWTAEVSLIGLGAAGLLAAIVAVAELME